MRVAYIIIGILVSLACLSIVVSQQKEQNLAAKKHNEQRSFKEPANSSTGMVNSLF